MSDHAMAWRGGEVTVTSREAVMWTATVIAQAVEALRQDGLRSTIAQEVAEAFAVGRRRAIISATATTELPPVPEVPVSYSDPIGVMEARQIMGTSDSYVRYLCRQKTFASARRLNGGHGPWQLSRAEVLDRVKGESQ